MSSLHHGHVCRFREDVFGSKSQVPLNKKPQTVHLTNLKVFQQICDRRILICCLENTRTQLVFVSALMGKRTTRTLTATRPTRSGLQGSCILLFLNSKRSPLTPRKREPAILRNYFSVALCCRWLQVFPIMKANQVISDLQGKQTLFCEINQRFVDDSRYSCTLCAFLCLTCSAEHDGKIL